MIPIDEYLSQGYLRASSWPFRGRLQNCGGCIYLGLPSIRICGVRSSALDEPHRSLESSFSFIRTGMGAWAPVMN